MFWFDKLAEQGNAEAQYNLAVMYHRGEGVERDYSMAKQWYKKSAEQGNAMAQYNLAVMYQRGEGDSKDEVMARYWFKKSCESGYQEACRYTK